MIEQLHRLLPGILLCVAITGVAILLQAVEVRFVGQAYLEALVLAILVGVAVRTVWVPTPRFIPGITVSAKFLLECAVVMLGASVSIATVLALGPFLLIGIGSVVAMALGVSFVIGRMIGLPLRMAILIACGNSICGNSAIAAVAAVIGANSDDIAASISFTAVLGVIVVLTLPLLVPVLQLSLTQYGVLAGLTVYAVPQVLAATLPIGAFSNQVGTIVKLVRVLMLGPVVLGLSLLAAICAATRPASTPTKAGPVGRTCAVVHHRLSRRPDRPLARPGPASRVAADHPDRSHLDDNRYGRARPRRRYSRRGEKRRACDTGGDGVADCTRLNQLRAHPRRRDTIASPRAFQCVSHNVTRSRLRTSMAGQFRNRRAKSIVAFSIY